MLHYYEVSGVLNGEGFTSRKKFKTRLLANRYVFKLLWKNHLQVEEDRWISKHAEEEYCDAKNRFVIARV